MRSRGVGDFCNAANRPFPQGRASGRRFLFGIADIEHQHIRECQAAEIAETKTRGVHRGRKSSTTKAKPKRAQKLEQQGLKITEIAAALDVTPLMVSNNLR